MTKLKEQLNQVREQLSKGAEEAKAELLKLQEGKPKTQASEGFRNSPRLHKCMSYDVKTGSYYIDYSKL